MDLIILIAVYVVIGVVIWFLTTRPKMPPHWATTIQILALVAIVLHFLSRVGPLFPNVLP